MLSTAAILVNWRQPELTLAAVQALLEQTVPPLVLVVDNGSADGSAERLSSVAEAGRFVLIESQRNLGFGRGCNLGLEEARRRGCEAVWLVNNDALPAPDCLERMLARLEKADSRAIVGCRIIDPLGLVNDHSGGSMNPWLLGCRPALREGEYRAASFGWISGASLLAPSAMFEELQGFDPRFFMYWEDADLTMRARQAGYPIVVAEDAIVRHTAGTSSAGRSTERYRWHLRSHRLFLEKHSGHPRLAGIVLTLRYLVKSLFDRNSERLAMISKELFRPSRTGADT